MYKKLPPVKSAAEKGRREHMFRLLPYLKRYKKESIIGPLFKLLEACFELIVPLVMADIIDVGIKNQDMGYILKMGGVLVFLGVLGLTCSLTAQYFAAKAAIGFGTELRHDLFAHIEALSYTEIDQAGSSTLVTRMTSDINQVQSGVNLVLRLLLRSPFIVVGAMVMAFTIDFQAALVFVVAVPLLAVVFYVILQISLPVKAAFSSVPALNTIHQFHLAALNLLPSACFPCFHRH